MQAFEYANPSTLKEAVGLLSAKWGEAEILAGGTDLLSLMKNYVATPKRLVNIKGIAEMKGIRSTAEGVVIGALVTLQELHDDKTIHDNFHGLAHAAGSVTSAQIRSMGTVGGDLCQRPRCWYFRNGFGLLAKDAKGEPLVPRGDNRYHAIFGTDGPAYFVSASSLAPMLVALGAKARLFGPNGKREVPLATFYAIPGADDERETVLKPNEILTEVVIPAASRGMANATYEVRQKTALDWPLATASVALKMERGKVASAKIVMGHVAPIPWQAPEAARWLEGKAITEETAAQAGEAAVRSAKPLSGNKYKVQQARVAVKRALLEAGRGGMSHG